MRYVILGTAGHIDHGKSALVKALTGIDPDRLKEEKERGITIDLGFADLVFSNGSAVGPDGLTIGIVDVPGHERLIRNMLAGAGGIDIVLMVIAADEGIMPQSREHLHICNLLKIKSGLIAITKADLVEPDWLSLVTEEVRGFVRGTFLEGVAIVPVSSVTGQNLDLLKEEIRDVALRVEPKPSGGLFRLPVDRVFTMKGFGTVVTGTAVSGSVALDEPVEVLPAGINTRIRGLQSHGKPVERVYAGQRAALNLQGVEKADLNRGDTVVTAGRFSPTDTVDASVETLSPIKNRALVHFHLGTSEVTARIILLNGKQQAAPGESSYCQLRLDAKVVAQSGDRFIIRRFSPLETIGGGEVLDPTPSRRRRKEGIDDLEAFATGELSRKIAVKVEKSSLKGMTKASLEGWIKAEVAAVQSAVRALKKDGTLMEFDGVLIHKTVFTALKETVIKTLSDFHTKNPLSQGTPKEELRAALKMEPHGFASLISAVPDVVVEKDLLRLKSFRIALAQEDKELVLQALEKNGFQPPTKAELSVLLKMDEKRIGDILKLMHKEGAAVRINDQTYLSAGLFKKMTEFLRGFFGKKSEMTVSEFRDLLGTSRKYALPFLEYLDSNGITLRVGDVRKSLLK